MPDTNLPNDNIPNSDFTVTTGAISGSERIYVELDTDPSVRVAMRQIHLHPTANEAPQIVYDTSGPYTQSDADIDIFRGLPRLREQWVMARGDVELYDGREIKPEDNGNAEGEYLAPEFPVKHKPMRAKAGQAVTQMAYAKRGIITPEMQYIAIRENMGRT